ncbi:MAG: arginine--tRNA ligase, partial [Lentimicrobiaceae bacterium]|nr:arginine--tRNA ligase [Lentimicrobiaceae bacterium]
MFFNTLNQHASIAIKALFNENANPESLIIQRTIPAFREFSDFSLVVFPLLKISRKSPEETARLIGEQLVLLPEIEQYHIVKGFLNLKLSPKAILNALDESSTIQPAASNSNDLPVVVEFSSPNTNKPLHLGHIRNNLLGASVAELLQAAGHRVFKVNLVNDRGIHICESMLAWTLFANNESPESSGKKGDKLVGDYYVLFDKKYKEELA